MRDDPPAYLSEKLAATRPLGAILLVDGLLVAGALVALVFLRPHDMIPAAAGPQVTTAANAPQPLQQPPLCCREAAPRES
jgi:hypothetical protein